MNVRCANIHNDKRLQFVDGFQRKDTGTGGGIYMLDTKGYRM
jgi:hypothetical protein